VNDAVWHALGTYESPAGARTAIVLESRTYDLERTVAQRKPNVLQLLGDAIVLPDASSQVDWEVELAAVIGRSGRNISVVATIPGIGTLRNPVRT
jgi:hypothetical protein